ncbi:unnamed protein product [Alopecurus aequalis]
MSCSRLSLVVTCDVTTIIRCATASKLLRDAIHDAAFHRRLALQEAADDGGFDPALLFGVSYVAYDAQLVRAHNIIHTPSLIKLHAAVANLQTWSLQYLFEPVASHGRLLLLCRFGASLQPPNVDLVSDPDAGGAYELIVADKYFRFQTFSSTSKHGQWDAVRQASVTVHPRRLDASSRVIGCSIYWLCHLKDWGGCWDGILALDVDGAEATTLELPPGCLSRMMSPKQDKHLLLASVRGRLSLFVAAICGISMWTLKWPTWSRQLVIGAEEIVSPVGLVSSPLSYVMEGFGERSGAVIVWIDGRDLLRVNLETNVVRRLHRPGDAPVASFFLHETDLASFLKKSFWLCSVVACLCCRFFL